MTKVQAIKTFFDVPGKPVTTKELQKLMRGNHAAYDTIARQAVAALGETIDEPQQATVNK